MHSPAKKLLNTLVSRLITRASRNYIAGPELADAQRISRHLNNQGYWVSLGYWDGVNDSPEQNTRLYNASAEHLATLTGDNYLSVKLPAIVFDGQTLHDLMRKCHENNTYLHFDSLAPEHASTIYAMATAHVHQAPFQIGVTLPGRWHRSPADAASLSQLNLNIRVVKGQWVDPEYPSRDPRTGYMEIINRLAGQASHVRVATHDFELAKQSLQVLTAQHTRCELELLYGLPLNGLVNLANQFGVPVRVYIAFGHAYLPYALASLRKHPFELWKLIKEIYRRDYLAGFQDITPRPKITQN